MFTDNVDRRKISIEEKKILLYLQQSNILEMFLEKNAISISQYEDGIQHLTKMQHTLPTYNVDGRKTSIEEKKILLYLRQMNILETFLEKNAISISQYRDGIQRLNQTRNVSKRLKIL